ncbi:MAG: arginyltransferase [Deltaproteobacteria bacterium]|nr:arginyltransferase [Deltaproteobacteria bacterium]
MKRRQEKPVASRYTARFISSRLYGVIVLDFLVKSDSHPCPYVPGRRAREEAFRAADIPPDLYHDLMDIGFRRSGRLFYRPACDNCNECYALRIPTRDFRLTKSQRRVLKGNHDIEARVSRPIFTQEKELLYRRYLEFQHPSTNQDNPGDLERFLYTTSVNTVELEYRVKGRLVAVGVTDISARSLSSVYTYFDPEFSERSLGTYSALREILFCREINIPFYYLGYYISACPAMSYKARFKPHELLISDNEWVRVERGREPQ